MKINPVNVYFKGQFDVLKTDNSVLTTIMGINGVKEANKKGPANSWRIETEDGDERETDRKVFTTLNDLDAKFVYRTNPDLFINA